MKNKILVIGSGAWGTALATVLDNSSNNEVWIYGINIEQLEEIKKGYNSKVLKKLTFKPIINAISNFDEIINDMNFIIIAIPTDKIEEFLILNKNKINKNTIIVNTSKGFDLKSNKPISYLIERILNRDIVTLIGPSFATELVEKNRTIVNIIGKNIDICNKANLIFSDNDYFICENVTENIESLLYISAMKNIFAIFMGFLSFKEKSINTQACFFIEIMNEIKKYLMSKDINTDNLISHSALGDVFLTCVSIKSRNFNFGYNVAKFGIKKALNDNTKVIEGFTTINNLRECFFKNDEYPFLKTLIDLIDEEISSDNFIDEIWKILLVKKRIK